MTETNVQAQGLGALKDMAQAAGLMADEQLPEPVRDA